MLSAEDVGDSLAAVQGLSKKHDAFEVDFQVHCDRTEEINKAGEALIAEVGNHQY